MRDLEGKNEKRASKERGPGAKVGPERTEVFGEEDHAEGVDAEGDNFRDDHVNMPADQNPVSRDHRSAGRIEGKTKTYQIVISNATMMSSLTINAVNEIATMFKNSFSNRTRARIMIAAPGKGKDMCSALLYEMISKSTLVDADHEPDEECFV
jgi:hypothetical protein